MSASFKGTRRPSAIAVAPGLNFDPFRRPEDAFQGRQSPEFVLQTFKTQNDVRGAPAHPPVRSIFHGLQKPEIA
jgi:hypothetical protein